MTVEELLVFIDDNMSMAHVYQPVVIRADMTEVERQHTDELLRVLQRRLAAKDSKISGFNVGANCGEAAGQTIAHGHAHLIPRRQGDGAAGWRRSRRHPQRTRGTVRGSGSTLCCNG